MCRPMPTTAPAFLREADLASELWHPNIVSVHDRGEDDGQLWISMDFVDGLDVARLLADRYPVGMPVEDVARSSRRSPVRSITPTSKAYCTETSSQPTS